MPEFILRVVEPLLSLLEQLGLKQPLIRLLKSAWVWVVYVMTAMAISLYGAWLWLWGITPAWAVPLLIIAVVALLLSAILLVGILVLRFIEQWIATKSRLSFDPSRYRVFGSELLQLSNEIQTAYNAWHTAYPSRLLIPGHNEENWHELINMKGRTSMKYRRGLTSVFFPEPCWQFITYLSWV